MSAQDQDELAPTQDSLFSALERETTEEAAEEEVGVDDVEEDDETEEGEEVKGPPGRWEGSYVSSSEIDWLYKSRRIPEAVTCRRPGKEVSPTPQAGERVVFLSHFERGFGLPVSPFIKEFMTRFGLQTHHLPANAILALAIYITFCEGYLGLWPTIALWTKFFSFKKQTIPDKGNPNKELTQCGAAAISPRKGSILPRVKGLESCKMWQQTFFYVRNAADSEEDLIGLPAFVLGPPAGTNWGQKPPSRDKEISSVIARIEELKDAGFSGDSMVSAFISRRVLPLQARFHKMCHMSGPMDPTRITTFTLDRLSTLQRCKAIAEIKAPIPTEWEWGMRPFHRRRPAPVVSVSTRSSQFLSGF